ncbi:plasmid mobilization protein [Streptomyces sp. NPDC090306]|uniref:plasmid mobilization protein n=1 Tax=Streptomyces sp. NPDC090306 TaxID=3365961 RepID=UPI00380FF2CF
MQDSGTDKQSTAEQPARRPRRQLRNPASRKRANRLTARLTKTEYDEIVAAARARAVTAARFLVAAGLAAARGNLPVEPTERRDVAVDELAAARAQLSRVGNNLNQLTRLANSGEIPSPDDLASILSRVRSAIGRVDRAADGLVSRRTA